ncbi:hypothetical protein AB4343_14075 [Vibrio breoganii]|uniref:Secreted protein n=1 Tax=Vibrio breoganii TaxID=553239 RepID=A0ABX1UCS9_9VIBR|nr:hypothetical protein [Vibrio breoganii]MDN3716941.1 hypothetical protein [Vibrio breoganii]NMO72022.1 hypothetical protein [Vibrio breoganii]NMR70545.1 hypothetical protein [Vibrio breoganii]OED96844.1 hypothetical protein A1QG_16410 [Vibrio breoganii ZF-29]OEF84027.1 hypothetical protein B003_01050 [Vibrio breoganii 1C10]
MNLKVIIILSLLLAIIYLGFNSNIPALNAFKNFITGSFTTEVAENRAGTSNDNRRKRPAPEPYEEDTEVDANIYVE